MYQSCLIENEGAAQGCQGETMVSVSTMVHQGGIKLMSFFGSTYYVVLCVTLCCCTLLTTVILLYSVLCCKVVIKS